MSYGVDRSCQVYVGFLPNHATMEDCEQFFKGYGKIKSINLKPGYGFVVFEDRRDAEDAVKDLDGGRMCGEKVDIQLAKGPGNKTKSTRRGEGRPVVRDSRRSGSDRDHGRSGGRSGSRDRNRRRSRSPPRRGYSPPRNAHTLKILNLSTRCSWQDLKDHIRAETKVEAAYCQAHTQEERVGIVSFDRRSEMELVMREMDGFEIKGRKIKCEDSRRDRSRDRRRSRSRSRSRNRRSRSRSRSRRSRSGSRRRSRSRRSRSRRNSDEPDAKKIKKENGDDNEETKADNGEFHETSKLKTEPETLNETQTDIKSEKSETTEKSPDDSDAKNIENKTDDETETKMDEEENKSEKEENKSEKEEDHENDEKNEEMETDKAESDQSADSSNNDEKQAENDEDEKNSESEENDDSEKSTKSADS